jgi:hypothetical protein
VKFLNKWICKVRKHKGEITSYLPWVVVGDNHPNWVGTAGHCTRCGYEWDDTQQSAIEPIKGFGYPKLYYMYGKPEDQWKC